MDGAVGERDGIAGFSLHDDLSGLFVSFFIAGFAAHAEVVATHAALSVGTWSRAEVVPRVMRRDVSAPWRGFVKV